MSEKEEANPTTPKGVISNAIIFCNYKTRFKTLAFLSLISGLALLSVSIWVISGFVESAFDDHPPTSSGFRSITVILRGTLDEHEIHSTQQSSTNSTIYTNLRPRNSTKFEQELEEIWENVESAWRRVTPVFYGSTGIATLLGLLQVTSELTVLNFSTKGLNRQKRLRVWKISHFILSILLGACVLVPVSVDKAFLERGLADHLHQLRRHLSLNNALHNWKEESSVQVQGIDGIMSLLYLTILTDSAMVCGLAVVAHFMVRKR